MANLGRDEHTRREVPPSIFDIKEDFSIGQ